MNFQSLFSVIQQYFPKVKFKYKKESLIMKLIGLFNPNFMINVVTRYKNTIYLPLHLKSHPISNLIIILHKLVHLNDHTFYYNILYFFPQILAILCLPLLLLNWKIFLLFLIICILPWPAYFRMKYEKRAYLSSLYVLFSLSKKLNFDPHIKIHMNFFLQQFNNFYYYFMWPFNLEKEFSQALDKIEKCQRPFEDPIFDLLDDIILKIK